MQTTTNESTVVHSTFSLERSYPQPPARVFAAWADEATKRRWFAEGEGWEIETFTLDFRVGGRDTSRFRFQGGPPMGYDAVYLDIVPEQRIVNAYTMTAGEKRMSVSLATIELAPAGDGTRLVYTEQAAFFDGADYVEGREVGCRELLDKLGKELARSEE
jgi:uncharacterized protein YndB with AHSA1/START domain